MGLQCQTLRGIGGYEYTENDKREMKITFLFLFLQILNYKVFRIYHKKHQKASVNLKRSRGYHSQHRQKKEK